MSSTHVFLAVASSFLNSSATDTVGGGFRMTSESLPPTLPASPESCPADDDDEIDSGEAGNVEGRISEVIVKPPPTVPVAEELRKMEATARKKCMDDVSFHVEKQRMAWIAAQARSNKHQRQDIRISIEA